MEPMWSYDEEMPEWYEFRQQAEELEREHLALRTALRDAQAALRANPGDHGREAQIAAVERQITELEKRAPSIRSDAPLEVLLWGVPHG